MKIAIIGAGFSGMLAAYLLEKKGVAVTVFEKDHQIGGHCRTLTSKDLSFELGTVFSFRDKIKELLIELDVPYIEKFTYRNFVDQTYQAVPHLSSQEISTLMAELASLKAILDHHAPSLKTDSYSHIDEDLLMPLSTFLKSHRLSVILGVIAPLVSSYGFGHIDEVQAYYVFRVFDYQALNAFIRGEKLLFVKNGTSELIKKLSQNISDIRYSIEVVSVEDHGDYCRVETAYGYHDYDKVLITTKLPRDVIKDPVYNGLMMKIKTHPFVTCAYEVTAKNLVTTYYKDNLGNKDKVQFFNIYKQEGRTVLVAYAYGKPSKSLINAITKDLEATNIPIHHLITSCQWYIFPHLNLEDLTPDFYEHINKREQETAIYLVGSLMCEPALSKMYTSIKNMVTRLLAP